MKSNDLLPLVESFFRDHLERMCGASPHTVRAYRDTLRLFFVFIADCRKCTVSDVQLADLTVESVSAFLDYLELKRVNTAASRNYRLAALRSFFKHLVRHDLSRAGQYQRVLALESKKARSTPASYLEAEDVRLILKQPDRRTALGARNHALLLFLYNTGTRVSEALIVRKYAGMATRESPTLRRRRVTPHTLRHSCAVALLQSGVDVTVIRDYLGHASIATTSRYITSNLQMKRDALELFWRRSGLSPVRATPWKPKPDLLAFLSSL